MLFIVILESYFKINFIFFIFFLPKSSPLMVIEDATLGIDILLEECELSFTLKNPIFAEVEFYTFSNLHPSSTI